MDKTVSAKNGPFILGPTIELRIEEVEQLFDMLDPYPFLQRDLDQEAEEYIVSWARALPRHHPLKILVHLPQAEAETKEARDLPQAFSRFFTYRADMVRRDLGEQFRIGRRSLAIGLVVLAVCLFIGQAVNGRIGSSYLARFAQESLVIIAWVANWKPMEILLYDWLPVRRRLRLYERLARADVGLKPY